MDVGSGLSVGGEVGMGGLGYRFENGGCSLGE